MRYGLLRLSAVCACLMTDVVCCSLTSWKYYPDEDIPVYEVSPPFSDFPPRPGSFYSSFPRILAGHRLLYPLASPPSSHPLLPPRAQLIPRPPVEIWKFSCNTLSRLVNRSLLPSSWLLSSPSLFVTNAAELNYHYYDYYMFLFAPFPILFDLPLN